jgi:alkylation response protein AidB-like acyl-CoA dehydrogenase
MLTLADGPGEAAFRAELRAWAGRAMADGLGWRDDYASRLEVDRRLSSAGLLGISWPEAYGGRGAPPLLEAVLTEELGRVGVRRARSPSHQGINNLGPALIRHASPAQKERFLPSILAAREVWCQGFSEPDAGSDLASVRTTATADGDQFVVRGSKIWTSGADQADWLYALVRTGTVQDRHKGLSFLLMPMTSPGIGVRPIRQITGGSEFSEVFFDDVAVAGTGLVGAVGEGWRVAMTLLASERMSGRYRYATFRGEAAELARQLRDGTDEDRSLWLAQLGRSVAEIEGVGSLSLRVDSLRAAGADTGALASVNKLWWPAVHQRFLDLALRAATAGRSEPDRWYARWLESRPESIYGGSAQIQRNILSERHLGMPRGGRGS